MVSKTLKKLITIGVAAVFCAALLTGCGGKINGSKTVMTVGGEKVSLGLANFYARYQQGTYETYYGITEDTWTQNATEDETYEESVKKEALEALKTVYLEKQNAKDFDVKLSKDEKKKIADAAKAFMKDNTKKAEQATSASKEVVTEFLTLMTLQHKVEDAIKETVDQEVSDDEAAQKKMSYVYFAFSTTDEEGNVTLMEEDEKAAVKKTADAFAKGAAGQKDFAAYAKAQNQEAEEATFDAESTAPDAALVAAAVELKKGQVTDVIEGQNGYYVAMVTSDLDREATDAKKEEIIAERESEAVDKQVKKWKKATKIKVHKRQWKKVRFDKQGIKIKVEEATTDDSVDVTTE